MKNNKYILLLAFITTFALAGCNSKELPQSQQLETLASPINDSVDLLKSEYNNSTETIATDSTNDVENIANNGNLYDVPNSEKRVLCWGTSLTHGTGGSGVTMPKVLARLSGAEVLNYGGYAEDTNCIATRSGASELTLTDSITISADNETPVGISFVSEFGDIDLILKYTDRGLNPVTIDGITGNLSRVEDEENEGNVQYFFTRSESGDVKKIESGAVIIPYSIADKRDGDINIIWTAGNDNLQNTEDILLLIDKIDKMIEFSQSDKYIIVSEMNLHDEVPVTDEVNAMFEEHYKEHFVHLRKYFIENAFSDLSLSPSDEDLEDIDNWEIPRFFRVDDVHGNSLYYLIAGQQIYKRCQELNYLK